MLDLLAGGAFSWTAARRVVIERLLLFAAVAGGVLVIGQALRWFTARRQAAIIASAQAPLPETRELRVLLFTGPSCSACERQKAIIDEVRSRWPGGFCIDRVDAADNPVEARAFGVMSVPTTVVISGDGRIASITGGLVRPDELERQLSGASRR